MTLRMTTETVTTDYSSSPGLDGLLFNFVFIDHEGCIKNL